MTFIHLGVFSRRKLVLFVSIFLGSLLLQAESVKIVMEDGAAPWSKKDGTGYANEIVKAALNSVHVDAEYEVKPYSRCKEDVISGEAAACLSMSFSEETKATIVFSKKSLFVCASDFFTLRGAPGRIAKNPESILKGTLIGIVAGYEYPASVEKLKKRGIDFIEFPSEKSLVKNLLSEKVNYIIINHNKIKAVSALFKESDAGHRIVPAFNAGILESFVGFSKKHDRGQWLKKQFDEGYRVIAANGALSRINQKWEKQVK